MVWPLRPGFVTGADAELASERFGGVFGVVADFFLLEAIGLVREEKNLTALGWRSTTAPQRRGDVGLQVPGRARLPNWPPYGFRGIG